MRDHGPWKIKSSADRYRDDYVQLRLDQVVRPDGRDGQHVVVHMKPGVCVLALDDAGQVHLTREFHYGVGRESIEAVSGGIEPGEDPDQTACRELQEELGLSARHWQRLTTVDPFTTIVVSPTTLYLATGLAAVPDSPEGTEQIETVVLPLETAIAQVRTGQITHAPTCVALLLAAQEISAGSAGGGSGT